MFISRLQLMSNLDNYKDADIWVDASNPNRFYVGDIEHAPLNPGETFQSVRWLDLKASLS